MAPILDAAPHHDKACAADKKNRLMRCFEPQNEPLTPRLSSEAAKQLATTMQAWHECLT
jgi:hypothetical protein